MTNPEPPFPPVPLCADQLPPPPPPPPPRFAEAFEPVFAAIAPFAPPPPPP